MRSKARPPVPPVLNDLVKGHVKLFTERAKVLKNFSTPHLLPSIGQADVQVSGLAWHIQGDLPLSLLKAGPTLDLQGLLWSKSNDVYRWFCRKCSTLVKMLIGR